MSPAGGQWPPLRPQNAVLCDKSRGHHFDHGFFSFLRRPLLYDPCQAFRFLPAPDLMFPGEAGSKGYFTLLEYVDKDDTEDRSHDTLDRIRGDIHQGRSESVQDAFKQEVS